MNGWVGRETLQLVKWEAIAKRSLVEHISFCSQLSKCLYNVKYQAMASIRLTTSLLQKGTESSSLMQTLSRRGRKCVSSITTVLWYLACFNTLCKLGAGDQHQTDSLRRQNPGNRQWQGKTPYQFLQPSWGKNASFPVYWQKAEAVKNTGDCPKLLFSSIFTGSETALQMCESKQGKHGALEHGTN